jgi:hypothetical protein
MLWFYGIAYPWWLLRHRTGAAICPACDGDGSYSKLADCTTTGTDCACKRPRVLVDPCDVCGGSGYQPPVIDNPTAR